MSEADRIRLQHMLEGGEEAIAIGQERARVSFFAVSHVLVAESRLWAELTEELGIPVLRAGHPPDPSTVAETLDAIRRERDLSSLG